MLQDLHKLVIKKIINAFKDDILFKNFLKFESPVDLTKQLYKIKK